ncbi:hypothetical protein [Thiolapillus sp.]|uniref:hypothetical protein n=1 Tax=Thiolapillus sp. TaxID=2017437 RepID=UPI003AF7692F
MKKVTYADMLFTLMHGKNQINTMEKVACALMLFSGEKKKLERKTGLFVISSLGRESTFVSIVIKCAIEVTMGRCCEVGKGR